MRTFLQIAGITVLASAVVSGQTTQPAAASVEPATRQVAPGNEAARFAPPAGALPPGYYPGYVAYPGHTLTPTLSPELPQDVEQRASCVVQIDAAVSDMGTRPDSNSIAMLLSSTAFCDPVVEKTLKLPPGSVGKLVLISAPQYGMKMMRLEVSLKKTDKAYSPGAADALLKGLIERLGVALEQSAQADAKVQNARIQALSDALAGAKKKLAEMSESNRAVRDALSLSGSHYDDAQMVIENLRSQKRQAESSLASAVSRLAARKPENGPQEAVAAWEAAVAGQAMAVATQEAQVKEGKGSAAKLADSQAKLADSQAKLAEARSRLAAARQQGGMVAESTHYGSTSEIRSLEAQVTEQEQRLKSIQEQLAKLESPEMAGKLASYRDNQMEEQRLRNDVSEFVQRLAAAQRAVRDRGGLTITVIDGQSK